MEGLTGMVWSDLVMMRRALDALERLTKEDPGFAAMRDTIRIGYHFRRGDHSAVVRAGEAYMQAYPPFAYLGWAITYAQTALSYLELANAERALAISGPANALLTPEYRRYVVTYSTLEATHAASLIASGQREAGEHMFRALLDRLRASGEHTRACLMHEYRLKAARLSGDRTSVRAAVQDMKDAALASGNPSAILLAATVSDLRVRARSSPLPPATCQLEVSETINETVVTAFLRGDQLFKQRAQHAIQLLGQYGSSGEAYLFWMNQGTLELAAALDRRTPPSALERALTTLPANTQQHQHTLALPQDLGTYRVVQLESGDGSCMGFAAIRSNTEDTIPEPLVADIGRALAEAAS